MEKTKWCYRILVIIFWVVIVAMMVMVASKKAHCGTTWGLNTVVGHGNYMKITYWNHEEETVRFWEEPKGALHEPLDIIFVKENNGEIGVRPKENIWKIKPLGKKTIIWNKEDEEAQKR